MGAERAEPRVAVPRIHRQMVLEHLQMAAEIRQPPRLVLVAHAMNASKAAFALNHASSLHLVRADRRLDRRVDLHPGDVARVVVVESRHRPAGAGNARAKAGA